MHKTEFGAVRLQLDDEAALRTAYRHLTTRLGPRMAAGLVQCMAAPGVEMFIGGLQDPAFSPVVFCGSGGVLVELFGDAVCWLCPLTDGDAQEMIDQVRGVARLRGHRGAERADESALREALIRTSALLDAAPEISEMDINPLTVLSQGASALDVRIRVSAAVPSRPTRHVRY